MPNRTQSSNTLKFKIGGMHCASCISRVENAIAEAPGVKEVNVNLLSGLATVRNSGIGRERGIFSNVEKLGYTIESEQAHLKIDDIHCASCVQNIENAVARLPGVISATANPASKRARIKFASGAVRLDEILNAVSRAGYHASVLSEPDRESLASESDALELVRLKRDFFLSLFLALPVVLLEMTGHLVPAAGILISQFIGESLSHKIQFLFATVLILWPGSVFLRRGGKALWHLSPDMNSLVSLGVVSAWCYSVVATFTPSVLPERAANVYYESAVVIVTLILLGRYFEERSKGKANDSIRKLIDLTPPTAHLLLDGKEVEVPVSEVKRGDNLRIKPGDRIPVDGLVIEGNTYIDESLISGEPVPVRKEAESAVIGGTVNQSGSILIQATDVGPDSRLTQIIRMVEEAQSSKLPVQALVDRITNWFVPAIILTAALVFLAWYVFGPAPSFNFALVNAVAVLIVACPCAMGLATPISIVVATGRAATKGILFRKGSSLEQLKNVGIVAFDKTGTLTRGFPALDAILTVQGFSESEALAYAAALESRSEHPIAKAIAEETKVKGIEVKQVEEFQSHTGKGISGKVGGKLIRIGTEGFACGDGNLPGPMNEEFAARTSRGQSVFFISVDGELAGMFAIADQIKESAADAIRAIHELGLSTMILSGDNVRTVRSVGESLGIGSIEADLPPEQKIEMIRKIKGKGGKVAFVGDGINDAPALSEADVGIAIGKGTDIAIESADLVLMSDDLHGVPAAIDFSRATLRNISTNLFWAFAYNICLIPVAAGILYPWFGILFSPMLAAIAMALSSLFVVGNALRLRYFEPLK